MYSSKEVARLSITKNHWAAPTRANPVVLNEIQSFGPCKD